MLYGHKKGIAFYIMYYHYFGLKEAPFSIAPNPSCLLMTPRHQEALAHLYHGIESDSGFVLLTGDIGTGKTTVCRHFLNHLPESTHIAFIINPCLDKLELLQAICVELGIEDIAADASAKQLTDSIYQCLLEKHAKGVNTVLLIDEAQQLYQHALELIRLLTNLETDTQKLLKIILVGQPELNDVLARDDLQQLSQRITARYHIQPLDVQELTLYIQHRLQYAGYNATNVLFPPAVVRALYKMTQGVPRLINVVCDRALLGAYSQNCPQVTVSVLRKAHLEVRGNYHSDVKHITHRIKSWLRLSGPRRGVHRVIVMVTAVVLVSAVIFPSLFSGSWLGHPSEHLSEHHPGVSQEQPSEQKRDELMALADVASASAGQEVTEHASTYSQQGSVVIDALVASATAIIKQPMPEEVIESSVQDEVNFTAHLPTYYDDKAAAIEALFRRITSTAPEHACIENDQALARVSDDASSEWRCADGAVFNWQQFIEHNRPAVIRITEGGNEYYVGVLGIHENRAHVVADEGVAHLSLVELGKNWAGEFSYLWQAPVGFRRFIYTRTRASLVRGLAKKFSRIDGQTAVLSTGRYNDLLKQRILLFQRQHQLKEDGKAGTATLLKINEVLKVATTLDLANEQPLRLSTE